MNFNVVIGSLVALVKFYVSLNKIDNASNVDICFFLI